jgi:hypothetical protein
MWANSTRSTVSSWSVLCPLKPSVRKPLYEASIVPDFHVKTASRCACLPDRIVIVVGRNDYCWRDDVLIIVQVISAVLLHDAQSVPGSCLRHLYRRNEIRPNVGKRSVAGSARPCTGASPALRIPTGPRAALSPVPQSVRFKGFVPRGLNRSDRSSSLTRLEAVASGCVAA